MVGLVLIATAACGDDDDSSGGGESDSAYIEEIDPLSDEELSAQEKAEDQAWIDQHITGHIVTFPDGSTARCAVLKIGTDDMECEF